MKWTEIPTDKTHSAFQHFMVALGDQADVIVKRINAEPVFAERLANYALNRRLEPTTSQKYAREIMSKNFFGVEEAIEHFRVDPTRIQQFFVLSEIPLSEAVLEQSKDTHVLVAVFPLSILEVRGKVQDKGLFYSQNWYNKKSFAEERGEITWQLVRKTPVDNSTLKNWQEQQALLGKNEKVSTAQVMVYTIIGHFLATGERLFERIYVRTSSLFSGRNHAGIGNFDAGGLRVSNNWDGGRSNCIGVSSVRKF